MKLQILAQILYPLVIVGIIYIFISIYRQYHFKKKLRSPFTDTALLRLPGHSLRLQIIELSENINFYLVMIFLLTITIVNGALLFISDQGIEKAAGFIILSFVTFVFLMASLLYKMTQKMNLRNKLNLGYEGELITAQELNRLMPEGNYVYHDFQADKFNIDHILVGPAGVFAIETKARSKKVSDDNKKEATATYNGREIIFSGYKDTEYIAQAKRQAKWLANWLKSSTGEPMAVHPVLCLPGWFVELKAPYNGIFVANPKQLKGFIKSKTMHNLDQKKIQQIIHQLDQKCRDIEIVSKQYDKE